MEIQITCPHCREKVLVSCAKAFRGSVVSCPRCSMEIELVGSTLAELFWAVNQH